MNTIHNIKIASLSGGRDSTAMTVRLLELGEQVDHIVFCDTGYELPEMYEYLDKFNKWLQLKFGREITTINAEATIEDWAFGVPYKSGKHEGKFRGLPTTVGMSYCTRELKIAPMDKYIKTLGASKDTIRYFGYVARENRTASPNFGRAAYPLKEWGWNEPEVDEVSQGDGHIQQAL